MINLSFPTVTVPGLGLSITRKILLSRGGITSSDLYKGQQSLTEGKDYICVALEGSPMAQNYYGISAILTLAQVLPTEELQSMAEEARRLMYPSSPQALPASSIQSPQVAYAEPLSVATSSYQTPSYAASPIEPYSDPRIHQLGHAVASSLAVQTGSTPMSQQELFTGIQALQSQAVGHVREGFNMALTAQSQTADTIRKSRPTVTHNSDNRSYNAYEYANHQLQGMSRLQFGILISALICVASVGAFALFSFNADSQRNPRQYQTSPTTNSIQYRSN